jgi:hypothetical protein
MVHPPRTAICGHSSATQRKMAASTAQPGQQLYVNPAKAAIGHDQHMIARLRLRSQCGTAPLSQRSCVQKCERARISIIDFRHCRQERLPSSDSGQ